MSTRDSIVMPCGHELRHWRPLEGTIGCAIAFAERPVQNGYCVVCREVYMEREACAKVADNNDAGNWSLPAQSIAKAIRARGK